MFLTVCNKHLWFIMTMSWKTKLAMAAVAAARVIQDDAVIHAHRGFLQMHHAAYHQPDNHETVLRMRINGVAW